MINLSKLAASGNLVNWQVDESAIAQIIPWARKDTGLLTEELADMHRKFPFFYPTIFTSNRISDGQVFCPRCGDLITFVNGLRCISCNTTYRPPTDSYLGFVGQIPYWIGVMEVGGHLGQRGVEVHGHPFLKHIHQELMSMNSGEKKRKKLRYFLTLNEKDRTKVFFAPPIYAVYPNNWPRSQPSVYVERDYFDKILFSGSNLGFGSFHAYSHDSNQLLRLCNYCSWHRVTMRVSIEQRIIPKVMIDVMIADLVTVGKLNKVVNTLGTDVHSVYNWIGKSGHTERFQREFNKYVQIDS